MTFTFNPMDIIIPAIIALVGWLVKKLFDGYDEKIAGVKSDVTEIKGSLKSINDTLQSDKLIRASTYTYQVAELKQTDHELQEQINEHAQTCPAEHALPSLKENHA